MITGITYNCNPESLANVTPEAFVDAFENEVRAKPQYRDLKISVTFNTGKSEVTAFESDDFEADVSHEEEMRDTFAYLAEKALNVCCV